MLAASVVAAAAQDASITGTVVDASKAVVPGATVTATNVDTGVPTATVSDENGRYRLQNLPPGNYKLQAELTGFSTVVIPMVELRVGQNATVPFELKLADLNETITVTGEAPFVDVSSSQVTGNVNPRQMEALPLQGRNWMELSKMVKGMTANEVSINPGVSDDMFQLNLDGQQVTQKISGGFGQPRFSREAIAEFQIVTNLFDITQGRSAGLQVQAISRSGTNNLTGSVYGFFRDDAMNAEDPITGTVLPYENQQIGGSLGGPIIRNKLHYFASYEYEREPGTRFAQPTAMPDQSFTVPFKNSQWSFLGRADYQLTTNDRLSVRGSYWDWSNPVRARHHRPSLERLGPDQAGHQRARLVVAGDPQQPDPGSEARLQQLPVGQPGAAAGRRHLRVPLPGPDRRQAVQLSAVALPGLRRGPLRPDLEPRQPRRQVRRRVHGRARARAVVPAARGDHDLHLGAADISRRIPASAPYDISQWDLTGLDPIAQRFERNYNHGDWTLEVPGPTWAIWVGDTWRVGSNFTVNLGVRWDVAWNAAATPDIVENSIPIDNGSAAATTDIPEHGSRATSATATTSATSATSRRAAASPGTSAAGTTSWSAAAPASTARCRRRSTPTARSCSAG